MKLLPLLLLICCTNLSFGQYSSSYSVGDSLMDEEEFELAARSYHLKINEALINGSKFTYVYYYNLACCYSLWGKIDSAFIYLGKAQELNNELNFLYDLDLVNIRNDKRYPSFTQSNKTNFLARNSHLKYPMLAYELESMRVADQCIRTMSLKTRVKYKLDSLWMAQLTWDTLNSNKLFAMLDTLGWPDANQIGPIAYLGIWQILTHAPTQVKKTCLPLANEEYHKTSEGKYYYSIFIDKLALEEGDKQIYGTQVELINGCPKLSPVMDPENLNERRKLLGLNPIEEYLKGFTCE